MEYQIAASDILRKKHNKTQDPFVSLTFVPTGAFSLRLPVYSSLEKRGALSLTSKTDTSTSVTSESGSGWPESVADTERMYVETWEGVWTKKNIIISTWLQLQEDLLGGGE